MRHTREEVIERTIREFARLDQVVAGLSDEAWNRPLRRPEGKDPWTVKDALATSLTGRRTPPGSRESSAGHLRSAAWR